MRHASYGERFVFVSEKCSLKMRRLPEEKNLHMKRANGTFCIGVRGALRKRESSNVVLIRSFRIALDLLIGDRIVKIEVYLRCYDAIFYFASGKILRVFSDHLQSSKNLSSWDFYNVTDSFYLGPEDEIQKSSEDGRLTQKNYSSEASYDEIAISNTINKQTALIQGEEQFYKDDNFIKKHELNDILGFVCAYVDLLNDEDLLLYLENADPETPVSFRLLISHSAWRLSQDDAFLCSSDNDNSIQQQGLKRIRNDSIVDVLNTKTISN